MIGDRLLHEYLRPIFGNLVCVCACVRARARARARACACACAYVCHMHVFQNTAQLPQQQFGQDPLDGRQQAEGPEIFLDQLPLLLRLRRHVWMPLVGPDRLARVPVSHTVEVGTYRQHYGVMAAARVKDGTNVLFVFEISNIRTFCRYSSRFEIRKFAAI